VFYTVKYTLSEETISYLKQPTFDIWHWETNEVSVSSSATKRGHWPLFSLIIAIIPGQCLRCCYYGQSHYESSPSSFGECRLSANPQTKPIDLGCESTGRLLLSTLPAPFIIISHPERWYSLYRPTAGGRLSRPRHCSKDVQSVPKAVCRSGWHDKRTLPLIKGTD